MSEPARHTPGPWISGRPDMATVIEGRYGKYIYAAGPDGRADRYIAATGFDLEDWEEIMANARLIAAAPELLDALTFMIDTFEDEVGVVAESALKMAREAVKHAREGEL